MKTEISAMASGLVWSGPPPVQPCVTLLPPSLPGFSSPAFLEASRGPSSLLPGNHCLCCSLCQEQPYPLPSLGLINTPPSSQCTSPRRSSPTHHLGCIPPERYTSQPLCELHIYLLVLYRASAGTMSLLFTNVFPHSQHRPGKPLSVQEVFPE